MSRYFRVLEEKELNLLVYRDDEVIFSSARGGMGALLDAIDGLGRDGLRGAIVVDRIVGRAAALLVVYMGAAEVHALLISAGAKEVLRLHGLEFHFAVETAAISSRDGKGLCPFERLVQGLSDPTEAYNRIKAKTSEF